MEGFVDLGEKVFAEIVAVALELGLGYGREVQRFSDLLGQGV